MIPRWYYRILEPGSEGGDVAIVQRKLGDRITGAYTQDTAALVRGIQRRAGLPETGWIDWCTASALGEALAHGQVPEWFTGPERDNVVHNAIGDADAVRRFQSANGLTPTGEVDETLAILLADRGVRD